MVQHSLLPVPAASRALYWPSRLGAAVADRAATVTLHWETAGLHRRLMATIGAPPSQVIDLGCYPEGVRAHAHTILYSHCQAGARRAAGEPRPWTYRAGVGHLRPSDQQPGVLWFLQADGWLSLATASSPEGEVPSQPLGRYPLWEVLHWLGSPPIPPPPDEDSPFPLPAPLEGEIQAVIAWWQQQVRGAPRQLTGGAVLTSRQQTTFAQALAIELQAHLIYSGWNAALPTWREAERALGTRDDPDPVLIRAATAAGLWTTLLPAWSKQRPMVQIWVNPGQVQVARGTASRQTIWPAPSDNVPLDY